MHRLRIASFLLLAAACGPSAVAPVSPMTDMHPLPRTPLPPPVVPAAACKAPAPIPLTPPSGTCGAATAEDEERARQALAPLLPKQAMPGEDGESVATPYFHFGCVSKAPWPVGLRWQFDSRGGGSDRGSDVWLFDAGTKPTRFQKPKKVATARYGDLSNDPSDEHAPSYDFDGDGVADTVVEFPTRDIDVVVSSRRSAGSENFSRVQTFQVFFGANDANAIKKSIVFSRTLSYGIVWKPVLIAADPRLGTKAHAGFGFFPLGLGLAFPETEDGDARLWAPTDVTIVDVSGSDAVDAPAVTASLWAATEDARTCTRRTDLTALVTQVPRPEFALEGEISPPGRNANRGATAQAPAVASPGPSPLAPPLVCAEATSAEVAAIRNAVASYVTRLLVDRGASFDDDVKLTLGCFTHDELLFSFSFQSSVYQSELWRLTRASSAQKGGIESLAKSYANENEGILALWGYADVDGDGTSEAILSRREYVPEAAMNPQFSALFVRGDYPDTWKKRGAGQAPPQFTRFGEAFDWARLREGKRDVFLASYVIAMEDALTPDGDAEGLEVIAPNLPYNERAAMLSRFQKRFRAGRKAP